MSLWFRYIIKEGKLSRTDKTDVAYPGKREKDKREVVKMKDTGATLVFKK
jgi:hypothetical protein